VSVRTSGGDGGALYWAQRYKGERDEWKQTAEEIFRMACEIEQERDDSDCCVGLMVGLLLDAERECETTSEQADVYMAECERQAAEIVALRNEVDEERGQWMPWATGAFQQTFAREAAEEAAADYHAAWQDAEADYRSMSSSMMGWCHESHRLSCELERVTKERDDATEALRVAKLDASGWKRSFYEEQGIRSELTRQVVDVAKERDEANRALEAERAAHQVTAKRLEETEKQLGYLTPDVRGAIAQGCSVWCRERDEARRLARKYRSAYLRTGCIDAAPVAPDHWLNEAD
jgi:hypothetical protein